MSADIYKVYPTTFAGQEGEAPTLYMTRAALDDFIERMREAIESRKTWGIDPQRCAVMRIGGEIRGFQIGIFLYMWCSYEPVMIHSDMGEFSFHLWDSKTTPPILGAHTTDARFLVLRERESLKQQSPVEISISPQPERIPITKEALEAAGWNFYADKHGRIYLDRGSLNICLWPGGDLSISRKALTQWESYPNCKHMDELESLLYLLGDY